MFKPYYRVGAQKRMDGEDVFGNRITVSFPRPYSSHFPFKQQSNHSKSSYQNGTPNKPLQILPASQPIPAVQPPVQPPAQPPVQQPVYMNGSQPNMSEMQMPSLPLNNVFMPIDYQRNESDTAYQNHLFEQMLKERQAPNRNMYQEDLQFKGSQEGFRPIRGIHSNNLPQREFLPNVDHSAINNITDYFKENQSIPQTFYNDTPSQSMEYPSNLLSAQQFWPNEVQRFESKPAEKTFKSTFKYSNIDTSQKGVISRQNATQQIVELIVTNLDLNIEGRQMRRTLLNLFRKHVNVVHAALFKQSDGTVAAAIKVASQSDAQVAISQLHRHRVGNKRILIGTSGSGGTNRDQLRAQIIGLLQDVPGNKLPVFKFRELFETRYLTTISISELYRLQDVCSVIDEPSGRMVCLNTESASNTPSPDSSLFEIMYCLKHDNTNKKVVGWAEKEIPELPNVRIGLKLFTGKLHILLQTHKGTLPLQSFQSCYEAVTHDSLPIDETGVPLEHLVTCVAGVELRQGPAKQIIWSTLSSPEEVVDDSSQYSSLGDRQSPSNTPLATHLALFSRELVELLRTTPNCQISFTRFIPAYHHHFGRQCRVADYGFTRLADLFESLSNVVQILGEGNKRMITLSHRTQVRRFTGDLLRILKGSTSRQITVGDFAAAAEKLLMRPWDPVNYGVCELEDLLAAVPEHIVVVTPAPGDQTLISLPKREQTPEEVERTQQFAIQVIELLRHEPHCSMLFNKFVPAYHHYFNQQCRVADYGFTKLIELFEVLPDIVQIVDQPGMERVIRLTTQEALRILSNQIIQLIYNNTNEAQNPAVLLAELPSLYLKEYGFTLKPEAYQCSNFEELLRKIDDSVTISNDSVILVDRSAYRTLGLRIWRILIDSPDFSLTPTLLLQTYRQLYNQHYELNQLKEISSIVEVTCKNNEPYITLTSLYDFAAKAYIILFDNCYGSTNLTLFEHLYTERFGAMDPESADCPNMSALVHSLPDILVISGRARSKQTISINPKLESIGVPLPEWIKGNSPKWNYENNEKSISSLEATVQEFLWPTPKLYSKLYTSSSQRYSPPKPDTPPSQQSTAWNDLWGTPSKHDSDLAIPMPIGDSMPEEMPNSSKLMSPNRFLLSAFANPFNLEHLTSPPASAVPLPILDSDNTDTESCDSKTESFQKPTTPNRCKGKLRVAAQFKSPISLQ